MKRSDLLQLFLIILIPVSSFHQPPDDVRPICKGAAVSKQHTQSTTSRGWWRADEGLINKSQRNMKREQNVYVVGEMKTDHSLDYCAHESIPCINDHQPTEAAATKTMLGRVQ